MTMSFDLESFHREAVETPSHESVDAMRTLVVETLEAAGIGSTVDEVGNVVATRGPRGESADGDGIDETHLLLNTHIDTVPPHLPYERRADPPAAGDTIDGSSDEGSGEIVCGRGACDAKGPLASLLEAFLTAELEDTRLTLGISIDEETTQIGGAHLAETIGADATIVGEPTGLDVCTAARGQFEGTVTITGDSAHVANPERGRNAIRAAAPILEAIDSYDQQRGPSRHETLGRPLLSATMIDGGEATNQVPERCTVTFDRRSVPPETSAEFCDSLKTHLEAVLPDGLDLEVSLIRPETPFPDAFATDHDTPLVQTLATVSGGTIRPFEAATEASYFAKHGQTVVFGPGALSDSLGAVAHSNREYVRLPEVREAARAVRETIERLG